MTYPVGLKWPKQGLTFVLPAGDYRGYVISDGSPVKVRLTLDGIEGSTELSPTTPVAASAGIQPAAGPIKNVFTAGSTYRLRTRGTSVSGFVERHDNGVEGHVDMCIYDRAPSLPGTTAYVAPACYAVGATWYSGRFFDVRPLGPAGGSGFFWIDPRLKPGTHAFGGTYEGAQSVRDAAFVSLWINYERSR